jgi:chemotaxis family two-component system response regulator Rcp1
MNHERGAAPPVDTGSGVKPVEILLVEDSPADIALTRELLKEARVVTNLTVAMDGVEAMAMLRGDGAGGRAFRPDLMMLDLNLPRKDGREVLAEIKSDPALRRLPVVVLTTSSAERDVLQAYDTHANAYITKPVSLDQFVSVIRAIEDFWLTIARLPTPPADG